MASAAASSEHVLLDFAYRHVASMGRQFGDGAEQDLQSMISRAGRVIDDITDPSDQQSQLEAAQAAIAQLLDDAAARATQLPDYPSDLLGERSYFPARAWFCPRFPFC